MSQWRKFSHAANFTGYMQTVARYFADPLHRPASRRVDRRRAVYAAIPAALPIAAMTTVAGNSSRQSL
jgi:hypothetical protein